MYLVMKITYHTVFMLQNKHLKNMLNYYVNIFHYILIKDFDRSMTNKTKHHG